MLQSLYASEFRCFSWNKSNETGRETNVYVQGESYTQVLTAHVFSHVVLNDKSFPVKYYHRNKKRGGTPEIKNICETIFQNWDIEDTHEGLNLNFGLYD